MRSAICSSRGRDDALAEVADALEDAVAAEHLEGRDTRGAGQRVTRVGEPSREGDRVEVRAIRSEMTTPPSGT
jgi:hypothetical protein